MLHRTRKKNDINRDKWIGVGGKFEWGESPQECMRREVYEETGLLIHTQVIDIKCPNAGAKGRFFRDLSLAEDVAEKPVLVIRIYEDGLVIILQLLRKFLRIVFGGRSLEQIRTDRVVDHIDLDQQAEDIVYIMFNCSSDMHVSNLSEKLLLPVDQTGDIHY